ncbi:MAG: hypothetical protein KAT75_03410, partial [Dehalococcoidia bacterium]|nr:hypothetical protein [Dehalococcoidia bacterium]
MEMVRIKRRMTYPPTVAVVVAVVLAMVLVTVVSAVPPQWPNCNFVCTANDINVTDAWIGNETGAALEPCVTGDPVTSYLWLTFNCTASADRYAVRILGDLYVGANYTQLNDCVLDSIPGKTTQDYLVASLNWTCGDEVRLENLIVAWSTSSNTCSSIGDKCPPGGQCMGNITVPITYRLDVTTTDCCTKVSVNGVEEDLDYSAYFPVGAEVDLEGVDEECCNFVGWGGDASGSANTTVTMDDDKTVTVHCEVLTSDLTVTSIGCCNITVSQLVTVPAGSSDTFYDIDCCTNVTFTADDSADCCNFVSWDGVDSSDGNQATVHMDGSNKSVNATCTEPGPYTLEVISDGCCPIEVAWDSTLETVPANGNDTFIL